jgi:hypothetical protein
MGTSTLGVDDTLGDSLTARSLECILDIFGTTSLTDRSGREGQQGGSPVAAMGQSRLLAEPRKGEGMEHRCWLCIRCLDSLRYGRHGSCGKHLQRGYRWQRAGRQTCFRLSFRSWWRLCNMWR